MRDSCGQSYRFMIKNKGTGSQIGLIPVLCKSWNCVTCRPKKAQQVKAFIRKSFTGKPAWMLTFTYFHKGTALNAWKKIGANMNNMLTYARKNSGLFNYVRVVEPHKDGSWPHVHMLVDKNIASTNFVKNVTNWGFGWNFHCVPIPPIKASNYISKYLTKSWPEGDAELHRQFTKTRIVSSSRALGPIFKTKSEWTVVKLSNPSRGVHALLNAAVTDLKKFGATEIEVELISDGFLITSDGNLSPGFVSTISDFTIFPTHDLTLIADQYVYSDSTLPY